MTTNIKNGFTDLNTGRLTTYKLIFIDNQTSFTKSKGSCNTRWASSKN